MSLQNSKQEIYYKMPNNLFHKKNPDYYYFLITPLKCTSTKEVSMSSIKDRNDMLYIYYKNFKILNYIFIFFRPIQLVKSFYSEVRSEKFIEEIETPWKKYFMKVCNTF